MSAPVLVLNTNTKREHGRKAQLTNVAAAKAVADIIRTTLGPRSMLKMILDPMGGIVMTNDGNAILREVDVSHPAAKSMIELSRTQDEEVGDGTTSVIILAGALLTSAVPFLEKNMHPRTIVSAYTKAMEDALEVLDASTVKLDVNDSVQMMNIVRSSIGTKFVSKFGDMICNMALDAVRCVARDGTHAKEVDIKRYARIEKIPGGFLEDSVVLKGLMLNKDVVHPQMKRRIEKPRIILLDCPLEFKKSESQTNVEITEKMDWNAILKMEEEHVEQLCADIIKWKPTLIFTEKGVSDLAQHYLGKAGISVIRRCRKTDNDRIARATGATIVNEPAEIKESDVGTGCGLFEIKKIGDNYFTYLVECDNPKACTVVLRGASKDVLNEIERNLIDAMNVVRNIIVNPLVVPGGGAIEMKIANELNEKSKLIDGVMQWPYRAVCSALEIIPRTLVENCGGSSIRSLTALRAKHAEEGNGLWGIDGITGDLADMSTLNVWDPYVVKAQTIKTAIESATMLLRIDDIVSGMASGGGQGGAPPSGMSQGGGQETFGDERDG